MLLLLLQHGSQTCLALPHLIQLAVQRFKPTLALGQMLIELANTGSVPLLLAKSTPVRHQIRQAPGNDKGQQRCECRSMLQKKSTQKVCTHCRDIHTLFSWVYSARLCGDLSRPLPDCLTPPKGMVWSPPAQLLTYTCPDARPRVTRMIRSISWLHSPAAKP